MFSIQYIDEVFLEQWPILEHVINRHDVDALGLGIDKSNQSEEQMENENACGYKGLSYRIKEERLIVTSLFSEFWPNHFVKENVTTSFF